MSEHNKSKKLPHRGNQRGFSLVELSIVLVILGLLTGGILGGQALIKAAELRSVNKDVETFLIATHAFRDKYRALPGDMPNATRFWGAQAGSTDDGRDATCAALDESSPATGTATCNGNGNGVIANYGSSGGSEKYETFRAWQHLSNAGLINGQYTGVTNGNTPNNIITAGENVPASKLGRAGYNYTWWGSDPSAGGYSSIFPGDYRHVFVLGRPGGFHAMNTTPALVPEDAWQIDMKMDDGNPAQGNVRARYDASYDCTTTADPATTEYHLENSAVGCPLIFLTGF